MCHQWGIPHSLFRGPGDGRWTPRDRAKSLAYAQYLRTVCPQCGTRHDEWDHGHPGEEDAYVAVGQRCVGCQVIAEKQAALEKQDHDTAGLKVALVPVAVQAALDAERELKRRKYPRRTDDD